MALRREDAIGDLGLLEGSVRLMLVGRLGARRHRSLTARLRLRLVALSWVVLARLGLRPLLRLRLVALRLRLTRISLRREGIWEIRGGVVSRRCAWSLVGGRYAILVGIARYAGHLRFSALRRVGPILRFERIGYMLRLRLCSSRDRRIGMHLCKNRPAAGSKNRALSRYWLARSTCSRCHGRFLAPMSSVCGRTPGLMALGTDAAETVGEIGLELKGWTGVVPVPLILHGHGASPEPSPPPRSISPFNASHALPRRRECPNPTPERVSWQQPAPRERVSTVDLFRK